ncbi:MAG: hypothetical protein GEU98_17305 [Pseudonocardiaceae bacterium]|nr:hypothetical protein [Pseudonocardiaceae bacterium]
MNLARQQVWRTVATGTGGAVAAARQRSADAGAQALSDGGNAVDAAVAAALVAGVVEPMETTLAGSGFLLYGRQGQDTVSVEFGPRAPLAAQPAMFTIDAARSSDRGLGVSTVVDDENVTGAKACGVPATVAGLLTAHQRFGVLPRARICAPAIAAAYDGFPADGYFALEALANLAELRADAGARETYLVAGDPPTAPHLGTATLGASPVIRQPRLGRTLELIAERGADGFYRGEVADGLLRTVAERDGLLAAEDLAAVEPTVGAARRLPFRDVDVWVPHAPSGAVTELQMLHTWQALHPDQPPVHDDPLRLRQLAEVSWHAFADRYHWLGDPDMVAVPEQALYSGGYAAELADLIRAGAAPPVLPAGAGFPWEVFAGRTVHDPWAHDPMGRSAPSWQPAGATPSPAGTTHVSTMDAAGGAVSITHTAANHWGAKVLCPRTGLALDAAMGWFNARPGAANSIAGGKRPLANMGPVLLTRAGAPYAALGAPGGRRIINAVVQVILNLVERAMDAESALAAPRLDASGSQLVASERHAEQLPELDVPVRLVNEQHEPYGYELARPVLAMRATGNEVVAGTDPFSTGAAVAP